MNRAVALEALGRFGEAKEEFEHCLHVFENNHHARAKVLSSLAGLFNSQGDIMEGIVQERRALAIREQLPDPDDRATSHHNLAIYLHKSGAPSAIAEAARHRLAALVYNFVAGLGQHLMTSIGNYVVAYRRAHAAGKPLVVPRVADLLADPAFRPLADWLRHRGADVAEVQAAMDRLLEQARKAALEKK